MKSIIATSFTLALAAMACHQPETPKATLIGEIKGLKDSMIYIFRPIADSGKTDTVPVKDGKFTWTGQLPEPQQITIGTAERYMQVFLENKEVHLQGNIDSLDRLRITGSPTQDAYEAYSKSLADISAQEDTLYQHYNDVKDDDPAKAAMEAKIESLREQRHQRGNAYIAAHPESPVSVNLIAERAVLGEYAPLDSLYRLLAPAAQQSETGQRVRRRLDVLKRSAIGQPMIDFSQTDINGKTVRLSDFKGKYVLLDFWASWCGPCRAENPNVLKAYNRFKDKNFTVVGVSLDDKADKWKEAVAKDAMPWIQLSDLKGFRNEVAQQYGIQAIPFSFLIDPQGTIIAKELRGAALHSKLEEILK
ncbi:TlpA disulfide reductase family protein [Chitinophaga sp. 212800010-3]|uniref:TlpA disulfide reductase family protein n=1 Tax=unclassified Chitinophaga TaxID=2619133 RepID=UPI002DF2325D|nr:Thioredoxin domain-containing protein [Chitinophaga sp. 212800010-3]